MKDTNDRDDFDDEINDKNSRSGAHMVPKLGNTLDYYNDDMSRKVVGRLFAASDGTTDNEETPLDSPSIVKGFTSEKKVARDAPDSRYPMEDTYAHLNPVGDDAERPSSRRRRGGAISQASNQDPLDESDYNLGLYRKKNPLRSGRDPEPEPEPEPTSRSGGRRKARVSADYDDDQRQDYNEPKRPPKVYKKIEPQREFDTQKLDPFPAKRGGKPPARGGPSRKPRFAIHRDEEDDEDDDGYERGTPSMRMIIMGGSLFVGVLVFAIVVWQLISLNSRLADAEAEADLTAEFRSRNNQLTIENDRLTTDLAAARIEIETLENQLFAAPAAPAAPEEPPIPTGPVRTHTVQPGDTLSSIAQRWYGDSSQSAWMRIADANNMQHPFNVIVGNPLIIPE
ncbi:MAG: LysM peptidoglycan-binding domain-containing protein [Defluviitaleaceae bacterium]|nr:LysM peptidoglycan-binding domain-containing protein [Defluviitaleaceae bacterium]